MGILKIKFLLVTLVIIAVIFFYKNTSILSIEKIKTLVTEQLYNAQALLDSNSNTQTTVYSIKNDSGVTEYSDTAPENARSKSITIYSNANVIPAVPINSGTSTSEDQQPKNNLANITPVTPFTEPEKINQMLNDAKNIENVLNSRKSAQDQQLNDMQ